MHGFALVSPYNFALSKPTLRVAANPILESENGVDVVVEVSKA